MVYVLKAFQEIVQLERYDDVRWEVEKCIYYENEIVYETKEMGTGDFS